MGHGSAGVSTPMSKSREDPSAWRNRGHLVARAQGVKGIVKHEKGGYGAYCSGKAVMRGRS